MLSDLGRQKRWALIRLLLGYVQTTGALATALLALSLGTAPETLWMFGFTTAATLLSIALFRVLHLHEPKGTQPH